MTLGLKAILMHIHKRFNSRLCHGIIKRTSHNTEKILCSKENKKMRRILLTKSCLFDLVACCDALNKNQHSMKNIIKIRIKST